MSSPDNKIVIEERFGICEASVVQVCQKMPPVMHGHVSSVYWDEFCAVVNKDLKQLSSVRTVIFRIILLYIVIMVALYLVFEYFKLFGEIFMTSLLVEALVSVGILFAVIFLYILKFTGGIAKGWYISVKTRTETA